MGRQECIAMLLAGGQGSRLKALTSDVAKPAVSFGGKFRIIDFALSNCANSDISTVGVLTQYRPYLLHSYLGNGEAWDLDAGDGGISILPPYATQTGGEWYAGTADAVSKNLDFIESQDCDYVLILSGDQLYRMDYREMLDCHVRNGADLTIAVMPVPWEEASRFGILTADETGRITRFAEKPKEPESNLASMGIYIFSKDVLLNVLNKDSADDGSEHDFGGNVIPNMLAKGRRIFAYEFNGFWRDVGTLSSYFETSMDLLGEHPAFDIYSDKFPIMSNDSNMPPAFIGADGEVEDSLVADGSKVYGRVSHSIVSIGAYVGEGAEVVDAVLLPGARVEAGAKVTRVIVGENSSVEAGAVLGGPDAEITAVGNGAFVGKDE